ncbi:MAG: helix-turn-helix transcriptional regulator [Clostridia bacterium]|nr:helix-turn-helix transcriptional regulator [Clostridia bacterium]
MQNENVVKTYGYYYPVEKEMQLVNLIKSGNKEKAKSLLDEIINVNSMNYLLNKSMFKFLKYDISCTMIKILCDSANQTEFYPVEDFVPLKKISECESMQGLRFAVNTMIDCISANNSNENKNNFVIKIIDYVEKNYMNPELSVSVISDYFNVHISYLSTTFKKQMGVGLSEYIQSIRINKSKELLKESNKKTESIANDVGYFSLQTFVRVFKNNEGITPSEYRKNLIKR